MAQIDEVRGRLDYQKQKLKLALDPEKSSADTKSLARMLLEIVDTTDQLAIIVQNKQA
jgi:hypothetical protein